MTTHTLLPVLLILKVCHFSIRSFIIKIRKENYFIWGQISKLKIDPQRFPCWKLTPLGVIFSTGASIFNDRIVLFFNKFQLKNDRAGHFSMGVYFQRYTGERRCLLATLVCTLIAFGLSLFAQEKKQWELQVFKDYFLYVPCKTFVFIKINIVNKWQWLTDSRSCEYGCCDITSIYMTSILFTLAVSVH